MNVVVALLLLIGACSDDTTATTTSTASTATTAATTSTSAATTTSTTEPVPIVTGVELEIASVAASQELDDFPAADAVDGDPSTWWSSGDGPPQWIEIDFAAEVTISAITLTVSQDPPAAATHVFSSDGQTLLEMTQETADFDQIELVPEEPWTEVQRLRIETIDTPSWVAWREIEAFGEVTGEAEVAGPTPDLIFTGGPILTVSAAGTVEALAITGETITAVGTATELLPTAGADTQVIDLAGRTLMPGFVDAHTHLLNDAWRLDTDPLGGQQIALENGITTLANLFTTPEFLEEMQGYDEAGLMRVRSSLYLIATDNCGTLQGDWWQDHPPTNEPGEMLRIGGVKVFMDGGTCGPWAVSEETIAGVEPGPVFLTPEDLEGIYADANALGMQIVTHAVGDLAITAALDAHAATMQPGNPLRHRIDHVTMVTDAVIEGFQATRMDAALFGFYPTCPGGFEATDFGTAYMRRHLPLIEANPDSVFGWHGDDPWVGPINPLEEWHNMVTRVEVRDDGTICEPEPWLAERTFGVEQSLRMMTIDAAYLIRRETEVGSLEPGKYADLIVLSDNPLDVDPMAIRDIELLMTMVGGTVEVCNVDEICP